MTHIFGRNQPLNDMGALEAAPRFTTVADDDGDLAVYDCHTGRFAPFLGDTAREVAIDLETGADSANKYHWKDTL